MHARLVSYPPVAARQRLFRKRAQPPRRREVARNPLRLAAGVPDVPTSRLSGGQVWTKGKFCECDRRDHGFIRQCRHICETSEHDKRRRVEQASSCRIVHSSGLRTSSRSFSRRSGLTEGKCRPRSINSRAEGPCRGRGRSSATSAPSRVTVTTSPRATRSSTSPP
jgi:hypothetical protein